MTSSGGLDSANLPGGAAAAPIDLSVVIVTYNSERHISDCISSFRRHIDSLSAEIIVVDNASQDDTLEILQSVSDVYLLAKRSNLGFARAVNEGVAAARGKFLLLLNPDTEFLSSGIADACSILELASDIGIIGARLVTSDGRLDHACKRGFPSPLSSLVYFLGLSRIVRSNSTLAGYLRPDLSEECEGYVPAINGAFMLMRTSLYRGLGGLDPRYWMYMEDLDLCLRALESGEATYYLPTLTVRHTKAGSSGRHRSVRLNYWFHRSMWLYYEKNLRADYPRVVSAVVLFGVACRCALRIIIDSPLRLVEKAKRRRSAGA